MKKLLVVLVIGLMSLGIAGMARATTVDFTVYYNDSVYGTGSFSGNDLNLNSFLSQSELSVFQFESIPYGHNLTLGDLSSFADFHISSNTWTPNAPSWLGHPNNAFFTWDSRGSSIDSSWAVVRTSVEGDTPQVPEPGTIALLGLGMAGLAVYRKRRKSLKA